MQRPRQPRGLKLFCHHFRPLSMRSFGGLGGTLLHRWVWGWFTWRFEANFGYCGSLADLTCETRLGTVFSCEAALFGRTWISSTGSTLAQTTSQALSKTAGHLAHGGLLCTPLQIDITLNTLLNNSGMASPQPDSGRLSLIWYIHPAVLIGLSLLTFLPVALNLTRILWHSIRPMPTAQSTTFKKPC